LKFHGRLVEALEQSFHALASGSRHAHCLDIATQRE